MVEATRETLLKWVEELNLVAVDTTSDSDLKRMVIIAGKKSDPFKLSFDLQDFLEGASEEDLVEDCLGKYYDSSSMDCRRCFERSNCELITKGLTTTAFLYGAKGRLPGDLQAVHNNQQLNKLRKPMAQRTAVGTIAEKNKLFERWVKETYPTSEIVAKAVYHVIKKGTQIVVTIESVESNKAAFEVMFNRIKSPSDVGLDGNSDFKKKYDGYYYVGSDIEILKAAFSKWWEKTSG